MTAEQAKELLDRLMAADPRATLGEKSVELYIDKLRSLSDFLLARRVVEELIDMSPKFPAWGVVHERYKSAAAVKRSEQRGWEPREDRPEGISTAAELIAKLSMEQYRKHGINDPLGGVFERIADRLQARAEERLRRGRDAAGED